MLEKLKDVLKLLKELLELVIELSAVVRRHQATVAVIVVLSLLVGADYWFATHYPGRIVVAHYGAIGDKDCHTAWETLDDLYRTDRWASKDSFCRTYSTSGAHENVTVQPTSRSLNPFPSGAVSYVVAYEVIDRFTPDSIKQSGQEVNRLWLEIAHRNDYPRLLEGTLGSGSGANPSLSMRRRFKTRVTVRRAPRGTDSTVGSLPVWRIAKFESLESTLVTGD